MRARTPPGADTPLRTPAPLRSRQPHATAPQVRRRTRRRLGRPVEPLLLVLAAQLGDRRAVSRLAVHQYMNRSARVWYSNRSSGPNHRSTSYFASPALPDAWTRFGTTDCRASVYALEVCAKSPRMVPAGAWLGKVFPTSFRTFATASTPSRASAITGPDCMNRTIRSNTDLPARSSRSK